MVTDGKSDASPQSNNSCSIVEEVQFTVFKISLAQSSMLYVVELGGFELIH